MSKIFTVFGATGNQGGSVIKAILADATLSSQFKLRGITRDVSKPAAKALVEKGVEMVSADMSSQAAVAPAIEGAHTVFLVTNFWESMSEEVEVSQGKAVADACKAAGVQHLIFSSLINVTEASKGKLTHVTHFDGKSKVEQYIRQSGVPGTFVMPGFYMSSLLSFLKKNDDGSVTYAGPMSDKAQLPLFDTAKDLGIFVRAAVKNYPAQVGKNILAATEYITPAGIVAQFSEVTGKPANYAQISNETYKSFMSPAMAEEVLENMLLLDDPGYFNGEPLERSLALLDEKPTTWREYVAANKEKIA